jgi:histidyl-tRNA synthetase
VAEVEAATDTAVDRAGVAAYFDVLREYPAGSGVERLSTARAGACAAAISVMRTDALRSVIPEEAVSRLIDLLNAEPGPSRLNDFTGRLSGPAAASGLAEIEAVIHALTAAGVPAEGVVFDPAMVRGLEYYTGTIFETVVTDPPIGSITGGGRFDGLTALFGRSLPAVGTSLGVDRLIDVMTEHSLFPSDVERSSTQALVTRFDAASVAASLEVATALRRAGVRTELYLEERGLGEQIRHALRRQIPMVLIIGPDELAEGTVAVRDLAAGTQRTVPRDEIAADVRRRLSA